MNHDRIIELYARKLAEEATDAELAEFTELLKSEDEQFFHELISSWWKIENITNIHKTLTSIFPEDSPCQYIPHITLGLYHDTHSYSDIKNYLIKNNP